MSPELCAEAMFVSSLQPSQNPDAEHVSKAVEAMVLLHGSEGCAERLAQEFGDHPEAAARRMTWCRTAIEAASPVAAR